LIKIIEDLIWIFTLRFQHGKAGLNYPHEVYLLKVIFLKWECSGTEAQRSGKWPTRIHLRKAPIPQKHLRTLRSLYNTLKGLRTWS